MNNEKYNQIIHEAYQNYTKEISNIIDGYMCGDILGMQTHIEKMFSNPDELIPLTKEEFINKCKTDIDFSKDWVQKIVES